MPAEAAVGLATRGDWSASSACSYLVPMCGASHQLSRLHRQASHCSYELSECSTRRREMQTILHTHLAHVKLRRYLRKTPEFKSRVMFFGLDFACEVGVEKLFRN